MSLTAAGQGDVDMDPGTAQSRGVNEAVEGLQDISQAGYREIHRLSRRVEVIR